MFVEDLKKDFYNLLLGKRVLLLVHNDVDAICACKVILKLLKCDNISYTLVSVCGIADLKKAYEENNEEVKHVILVNCGGTLDIVDILQPDEDVIFFILDSHKPTDVCNVYSDGQVRLINRSKDEDIPNFDDIFRDDEESDDETSDGTREAIAAAAVRRKERRAWEEKRNNLMFNYTQFSYYGIASSMVALELAWVLSRADVMSVWCACVGLTSHTASNARTPAALLLDATIIHPHTARHNSVESTHIVVEKDIWLPLYRNWTLECGVRYSPNLAPYLKLHTIRGDEKVRKLLADMGYPLAQARQSFRSMDVSLRSSICSALETSCEKLQLPSPIKPMYMLKREFAQPIASLDVAYVLMAIIEDDNMSSCGLTIALDALESRTTNEKALKVAQQNLIHLSRIVNTILSNRQLHCAGPFNYFIVQEGTPESACVGRPLWLSELARWMATAKGQSRPIVALAPHATKEHHTLLLGLPPQHKEEPRNLFGKAFEQAALQCGCSVSLDYFETSVISLPTNQRTQFLDALTSLMS